MGFFSKHKASVIQTDPDPCSSTASVEDIASEPYPNDTLQYMDDSASALPEMDELAFKAAEYIIDTGNVSIGGLQRMFRLGFTRAARLLDQLAEIGIVSKDEGTAPRTILINSREELLMLWAQLTRSQEAAEAENKRKSAEKADLMRLEQQAAQYGEAFDINADDPFIYTGKFAHSGACVAALPNLLVTNAEDDTAVEFILDLISHNYDCDMRLYVQFDSNEILPECLHFAPQMLLPPTKIEAAEFIAKQINAIKDTRIKLFIENSVKRIDEYNAKYPKDKLPHIVWIITEGRSLSGAAVKEIEKIISGFSTFGFHLVVFSRYSRKWLSLGALTEWTEECSPTTARRYLLKNDFPKHDADPANFDSMNGYQFEAFCAGLLLRYGFEKAYTTQSSGDQGVDVIAERDGVKYAIQCKCYQTDVGNQAVQEALAGQRFYKCHVGVVLTNQYFTPAAKQLAESTEIVLWDRDKLLQMVEKSGENAVGR